MFVSGCLLNLFLSVSPTFIKCVPFHTLFSSYCCCPFFCFIAVCLLSFLLSLSPSVSLFFPLSDKLDEILAAAQQTISTNEAPGTRGQGPKRDRGRSFYGNEVCIVKHATVYLPVSWDVCVCVRSCVLWVCHHSGWKEFLSARKLN